MYMYISCGNLATVFGLQYCVSVLASFPGSSHVCNYCMTFDPHEKSEREPGEFDHTSDIRVERMYMYFR